MLGAGGPELSTNNVSTSYLLWDNGKARYLIDSGAGTAFHFNQTGANISDLNAIIISHMHVDHTADLISLIKSSYFEDRSVPLPIYGPTGNKLVPSMSEFMDRLVGLNGLYPYMNNFIAEASDESYSKAKYKLLPHDIVPTEHVHEFEGSGAKFKTADAKHGGVSSLAISINYKGKEVFITGDSSGPTYLKPMANSADLIIAHNALPQSYNGPVERLHMKPSRIAEIVSETNAHTLVLSHFLERTATTLEQSNTERELSNKFKGDIAFANDFNCYAL
ncbi:MBL fold metallo-hydrolase [Vibrio sp. Sgm 22]|uniref:MBL fold metallo-hydrolase n=1 Tax=unclassified Vibrio TaxID=2614977 RepID=UPI00224A5B7A|nr:MULTISPECIES: MBL fold metallo-hydrolase [unclassified Vibrio]MCX2761127.1 MBL fold metallo-hydrolase [Vibrio sp. 14G-20]MCX2778055.1 MBL fold metallo-hydrolase [Vibrio sp. Sgm 22]